MNRRDFIGKSTTAAIITAGLPLAIKKYNQTKPQVYKSYRQSGKSDQTEFTIRVHPAVIQNLSTATTDERTIGLKADFFASSQSTTASKTGNFSFYVEKTELIDKENNIWRLTTKAQPRISGDYEFPKAYPDDLKFVLKPTFYLDIAGKKNKTLATLTYLPPSASSSDDGDCFLTTACVRYQSLPDNCEELQTLRVLRDSFMQKTKEGQSLVNQYQEVGPELVRAISSLGNKEEIYGYMYHHMILPTVDLVKQNRLQEAVDHYAIFVAALRHKYSR